MLNFAIPAMYTDTYLNEVDLLNKNSRNNRRIKEIYGSIPSAPIGTIRPSSTIPNVDINFLCEYIKKVNNIGIEFDYIMNSTVLDGCEYTSEGKQEIIDFVGQLVDSGLNTITISVPYVIRLIKKYFPSLNITASICAEIDSVQRALDFEGMGVNCIVPAKDINRDFPTLEVLSSKCNSDIKLLCTTPCLYKCSDLYYHMNLSSVLDNSLKSSLRVKGDFLSHTAARCQRRRLEHIPEHIKSPWIRPEDLSHYENIGITNFKLDGRDKTEEYNLLVAKAYMDGSFSGNLLYLMHNFYAKDMDEFNNCGKIGDESYRLGVYLDNTKLDGFINYFSSGKANCKNGCSNCNYCEMWSNKAITINKDSITDYLNRLKLADEKNLDI